MAQIKKKTVKELLESYAEEKVKFTPYQFLVLLRLLSRKKDGSTSDFVQRFLAPIYAELTAGRMPHPALVTVVLAKMNRPFFRRKKNPGGDEEVETEMAKTPGTRVKASNFVTSKTKATETAKPQHNEAELRKKLTEQWRAKVDAGYKEGNRDLNIKSVGNGL